MSKEEKKPKGGVPTRVYIDPSKIPADLLAMLEPGKIRTADDLTDFAGLVLKAMLAGEIPPQWSKILRDWAGLMFTNIASKGALASVGAVNFNLLQVIQAAERPKAPAVTTEQPIDVQSVSVPDSLVQHTPPLGPQRTTAVSEPLVIELDFSDEDE